MATGKVVVRNKNDYVLGIVWGALTGFLVGVLLTLVLCIQFLLPRFLQQAAPATLPTATIEQCPACNCSSISFSFPVDDRTGTASCKTPEPPKAVVKKPVAPKAKPALPPKQVELPKEKLVPPQVPAKVAEPAPPAPQLTPMPLGNVPKSSGCVHPFPGVKPC